MLKVGLVGVGGISGAHIPAWDEMDNAELVAICDKDTSRVKTLADRYGFKDYAVYDDMFKAIVHDIALHIAASNPQYVTKEEVPADVVEKEKEIAREKARQEGKPEAIAEKIDSEYNYP